MKKTLFFCMSIMLCLFIASPAVFADVSGDAIVDATVKIAPNITVDQDPTAERMMDVQTGEFCGSFIFRVDSNLQYVQLGVGATDLYKGGMATAEHKIPLADSNVTIDPVEAGVQSLSLIDTEAINGLAGLKTATSEFESGQGGHFSSDVTVVVCWDQDDPERPQGDYSGFVKLYAMINPS